jgi:hypothetical protein
VGNAAAVLIEERAHLFPRHDHAGGSRYGEPPASAWLIAIPKVPALTESQASQPVGAVGAVNQVLKRLPAAPLSKFGHPRAA